ncbi:MAG: cysteine desulfurase [Thaumarchaeota archaeon]|nr:cysteine desulfurase [Nitrososphaerota archaeon]
MAYLDYNATTPVDRRVLETMMPLFAERFGNPSSGHGSGRTAAQAVEEAREKVADAVGMGASDVVFTSGATEANNLALTGLRSGLGRTIRILAGATEHKSVLQTCATLADAGSKFKTIPVHPDGTVDIGALECMMSNGDIDVVSVMAANSETGVIHPVEEVACIVHDHGALFHCDATQAIGKIPFDGGKIGADMVTLSSHKIYGPKGCGALVATRESRRRIAAIIYGGGQERDMRSGTPNVPAIAGFGEACSIAATDGLADIPRQRHLRDEFESRLLETVPDVSVNGSGVERLSNTSNIRLCGALADAVMARIPSVEISTGSACSSNTMEPSHVLLAMGLDRTAADESVRISVGRETTATDIKSAVLEIAGAVESIRAIEGRPRVI